MGEPIKGHMTRVDRLRARGQFIHSARNKSIQVFGNTLTVIMAWVTGADPGFPIGVAPTLVGGGTNLRHRHFSVKTYVKMKEFGPVGGGRAGNFCM